jgi:CUB/sushi domain-containing protein
MDFVLGGAINCAGRVCDETILEAMDSETGQLALSNGGLYPSTATYTCNPGFVREGTAARTCGAGAGQWAGFPALCSPVLCAPLPAPHPGGIVQVRRSSDGAGVALPGYFHDLASYGCTPGYTLRYTGAGEATDRRCGESGHWSGVEHYKCVDTCAEGDIKAVLASKIAGAPWTPIIPPGVDYSSCALSSLGTPSERRDTCVVTRCAEGYAVSAPGSGMRGAITCGVAADGQPDLQYGGNLTCVTTDPCLALGPEELAAVAQGFPPHASARGCSVSASSPSCNVSSCELGHYPSAVGQSGLLTCTAQSRADEWASAVTGVTVVVREAQASFANVSWGDPLTCVPVRCRELPPLAGGHTQVTNERMFPSVASFSCSEGYALEGESKRTCTFSGVWKGSHPSCLGAQCHKLKRPDSIDMLDISNGRR